MSFFTNSKIQQSRKCFFSFYYFIKINMYGYDGVAKLSDNETKAVPYVVLFNQLICCAWLSGQEKCKHLLRVNQKMTAWIYAHFDKLTLE